MERVNKDKIFRLCSLIIHLKGKSKYKKDLPKIHFFAGTKVDGENTLTFGEYYNEDNLIQIWYGSHTDFKDLASTILHEYAHYLQFWPWYTRYEKTYTYRENPYEIEARELEKLAPSLVKLISENEWDRTVRRNRGILKIYEKSINSITIETNQQRSLVQKMLV